MMQRPENLWPLFGEIDRLPGLGPKRAQTLARQGMARPIDLLLRGPREVIDRRLRASLIDAPPGRVATVEVEIGAHRPPRGGKTYLIDVRDAQTEFQLVFFSMSGERLRKLAPSGARRVVSGRVEMFEGRLQMPHPDWLLPPEEAAALPKAEPVYPAAEGLPSRIIAAATQAALGRAPEVEEWLDPAQIDAQGWPGWRAALAALHAPTGRESLSLSAPERARLAYDELFSHQIALALARRDRRRGKGHASTGDGALRAAAAVAAGFAPTGAQTRALDEIAADMAGPERMVRLLQGDVGAGKTWVALMAMLIAVEAGGQAALMAPTSVLARQHLLALSPLAGAAGVSTVLLTGRDKGAARREKLAQIASGAAQLVIGTHALFQADVDFADLRLAIIDEQHRFGVRQRMELGSKGRAADQLVMTATPIPRTLALAGYGDMDISVLDEKPPGRRPVETRVLPMERLDDVIDRLADALEQGRRAYWVCPLVEDSEAVELAAAEARFAALEHRFGADVVRLAHGQMAPEARDAAMADFSEGRARLLVATTVIEVGVDVPEASIMVIEHAETFGLAQLHQLRGRVGRGAAQSVCLMLHGPLSATAEARLKALRESEDGFVLAEEDLKLRGQGDLLGERQSGAIRLRLGDEPPPFALLARARDEARLVIARDPDLTSPRGEALRLLLWLHEREQALTLLRAG